MSESKTGAASVRRPRAASGRSATTSYDRDVILWSQEQARLLRAGRFSELDIEHLADEIEDVGKSEKRELASRMQIEHHSAVELVNRLEARGCIQRERVSNDRREVLLVLTPKGERLLAELAFHHHEQLQTAAPALVNALRKLTREERKPFGREKTTTKKKLTADGGGKEVE